ncbi:sensor histidine kinase [Nonomuraea sp. NPDC050536]|uniref:sensor histidine kinase n=1 Tax=Nonomuraea sp. NPDC050536 TaxID=3364366 RepID=UPI0037C59E45
MRQRIALIVAVAVAAAGAAVAPGFWVAAAGLVWWAGGWPRSRASLPVVAAVAGAVSLAVTAAMLGGLLPAAGEDAWALAESVALIALTGVTARWAPVRRAVPACVVSGIAASTWLLRYFAPQSPLEAVGACAFWSLGAAAATGAAVYLRSLETGRARAVAAARAAQRLHLARDLHDFVAHDVSEMLAQAQAGQIAGTSDPEQALRALRRVEEAGLRAMATLDRTVLELHDAPPDTTRQSGGPRGLAGLDELAERFEGSSQAKVRLSVGEIRLPAEADTLAYRIVVEALTNVRRHAPEATRVDVTVRPEDGTVVVEVDNDGVEESTSGRGGLGLKGLAEQVEAVGGELTAEAVRRGGWSLRARLPLPR